MHGKPLICNLEKVTKIFKKLTTNTNSQDYRTDF
jgi:hypothetical protein